MRSRDNRPNQMITIIRISTTSIIPKPTNNFSLYLSNLLNIQWTIMQWKVVFHFLMSVIFNFQFLYCKRMFTLLLLSVLLLGRYLLWNYVDINLIFIKGKPKLPMTFRNSSKCTKWDNHCWELSRGMARCKCLEPWMSFLWANLYVLGGGTICMSW